MTITCRLWSKAELQSIINGENDNLATILANGKTFSQNELAAYHSRKFRQFIIWFTEQDYPIEIKAIDEKSLAWFLAQDYNTDMIESIFEKVVEIKEIEINF